MKEVVIIGAGPAGLFCALQLLKNGVSGDEIVIYDAGPDWKYRVKRSCGFIPETRQTFCTRCQATHCNMLQGFGGAGGFSDGKINLSRSIGGNIKRADLDYYFSLLIKTIKGLDENLEAYLEPVYHNPEGDLHHLGTDGCVIMLTAIRKLMEEAGVEFKFMYSGRTATHYLKKYNNVVYAVGRTGNSIMHYFLYGLGDIRKIVSATTVDVGFRVELPFYITQHLTDKYYEFKLRTEANGLDIRTFCVNPNGYVVNELIGRWHHSGRQNRVVLMNGHSYSRPEFESGYTNFAVLAKIPFGSVHRPNEYALDIAKSCKLLNNRDTISQRLVDFMIDKKTDSHTFAMSRIFGKPMYFGENGNLNFVYPERIGHALKEGMRVFSKDIPGLFDNHVWIHGVEAKCYSNKVKTDPNFMVAEGVYCIGDGSGWTRGLAQAAASGMMVADTITMPKRKIER